MRVARRVARLYGDGRGRATIDGLSHIQLRVSDLDASVAWYERALGLTELRGEPGRYVALQSTTGRFRVVLSQEVTAGASGALDHVAFAISDVARSPSGAST